MAFNQETLEDTKVVNRSTDNIMAMSKSTNNDLQSTTQKTKDRGTRTQLKTGGDSRCS